MNVDELAGRLDDLSGEVVVPPLPVQEVRQHAGRIRRRRRTAAAAVLVAVLAGASVAIGGLWGGGAAQLPASAPAGPFLGWSTYGANSAALTGRATTQWESTKTSASHGPYSDVHTLLATSDTALGPVVMLEAYDSDGRPRLAILTGTIGDASALVLRADRPAPDPNTTRVVSIVSTRFGTTPGATSSTSTAWAIALGAPGMTHLSVASPSVDMPLGHSGSGSSKSRLVIQGLPPASSALTSTVNGYVGKAQVFKGGVDGGAFGDAVASPTRVTAVDGGYATVKRSADQQMAVGELAVTPNGLVGQVSGVTATTARIQLMANPEFMVAANMDISHIPVTLTGTGRAVQLVLKNAADQIYATNRVMVADPAEHSDQIGEITAGRVANSTDSTNAAGYVLDATAKPAAVGAVIYIMTPDTSLSIQ